MLFIKLKYLSIDFKKKNPITKNQRWKPIHKKYKANENTNRHNPKKKKKQTINKNQIKTLNPMQRDITQRKKKKETINKNQMKALCKEDW
jgi:hypothetical protein